MSVCPHWFAEGESTCALCGVPIRRLFLPAPSPEALDLRHAGHARLMDPEPGEHCGYAPGLGPE